MEIRKSDRGFINIFNIMCPENLGTGRIVGESKDSDFYDSSPIKKPGSSYLWIGKDFRLHREEVQSFIHILQYWLDIGRLPECMSEVCADHEEIYYLVKKGHPKHCSERQVHGDGCCECNLYKKGYNPYAWQKE